MVRRLLLTTLALASIAPGGAPVSPPPDGLQALGGPPEAIEGDASSVLLGVLLAEPPSIAPGGAARGDTPTLETVRLHLDEGDIDRAIRDAERIVDEGPWGSERTLASFVLGTLYRERGLHNLASESFTRVRAAGGPLAEWAAFHEAEQDHLRGKPWVAVGECRRLRERSPKGRFDAACQRLMARALVDAGRTDQARSIADEHDLDHPEEAIREQIDLAIARRWAEKHPELAVPLLRKLVVDHEAPLTGRVAESLLDHLREEGVEDATVPDDSDSLMRRAVSLREAKRKHEAWDLFQEVKRRAVDEPRLQDWVEGQEKAFGWRTHHWEALVPIYAKLYAETNDPDEAWNYYKSLDRGGRSKEALAVAKSAQAAHGRHKRWRRSEEIIGRTALLAKDYPEARRQFDMVAERGGWAGRRSAMYAGFAAHMAGENEDAVSRLTRIIDRNRGYVPHALYWRAKAHDALGHTEDAEADRQRILVEEPLGWYATLVRQRDLERTGPPWDRTGRWAASMAPELPGPTLHTRVGPPLPGTGLTLHAQGTSWVRPVALEREVSPFAAMTWPLAAATPAPHLDLGPPESDVFANPLAPPPSYRASAYHDPEQSWKELQTVSARVGKDWPEWTAARDLARAGLYDLSGPLMAEIHEEWREAWRSSRHPRHAVARRISSRGDDWRRIFYATRDHHHTDRFTYGLWDKVEGDEARAEALRLGWPLAHDRYVWSHARDHDVDPYLVMAIMRVESRYDAIALSRVGARGAMQIMPRTGRLIADLEGDERFLAGDLEDPVFAVGYGITYMGKLLDRFDGAYPLAVASYNGGPFNVSSWLQATGPDMPMDEFVEHIPFRETRRYVRSVTAAYDTYVELYAEDDAQLLVPHGPYADDPAIVDF